MTDGPQFKKGDKVESRHSGKIYIVETVYALDTVGSYACAVRGWRGGKYYGPTRQIAESRLRLAAPIPKDAYDYAADDLAFDAAREDRVFGKR